MSVLVTGGAGYIGGQMVLALLARGERVVVLDNLCVGRTDLLPPDAAFVEGDVGDRELLERLIGDHRVEAVMHFAGLTSLPDSFDEPLRYYAANTAASLNLIAACAAAGVRNVVFSSTAAVYGPADVALIGEDAVLDPASPYGRSKLMTERILADVARTGALAYVALRYFNVAGADPQGLSGPSTPRPANLIRRACQTALGRLDHLGVFGTDYPTPDGTCVRDFIHIADLLDAHLLALDHLRAGGASLTLNCGYGQGASVRDVIASVERVSGVALATQDLPRRPGDLPVVVADARRLRAALGWTPRYQALDTLIAHSFAWERRLAALQA